jgi:hypothetical protein
MYSPGIHLAGRTIGVAVLGLLVSTEVEVVGDDSTIAHHKVITILSDQVFQAVEGLTIKSYTPVLLLSSGIEPLDTIPHP